MSEMDDMPDVTILPHDGDGWRVVTDMSDKYESHEEAMFGAICHLVRKYASDVALTQGGMYEALIQHAGIAPDDLHGREVLCRAITLGAVVANVCDDYVIGADTWRKVD